MITPRHLKIGDKKEAKKRGQRAKEGMKGYRRFGTFVYCPKLHQWHYINTYDLLM
jgi:hypothetical protein